MQDGFIFVQLRTATIFRGIIGMLVVIHSMKRICLEQLEELNYFQWSVFSGVFRTGSDRLIHFDTLKHCHSKFFTELTSASYPVSIPEYNFSCLVFIFLTISGILLVPVPYFSLLICLLFCCCSAADLEA